MEISRAFFEQFQFNPIQVFPVGRSMGCLEQLPWRTACSPTCACLGWTCLHQQQKQFSCPCGARAQSGGLQEEGNPPKAGGAATAALGIICRRAAHKGRAGLSCAAPCALHKQAAFSLNL